MDRHLATLPNSVIVKTLNVFSNKFPELGILHLPTFMREFESSSLSRETMALLGAVLAVTRAQLSSAGGTWAACLRSREDYAVYAKRRLGEFMLLPPRIQVVQGLLIITLHEWGTRDFHKAWVYCGALNLSPPWCPWERQGRVEDFLADSRRCRHRHPYHAGPPQPARVPLPAGPARGRA